jgi:hypothetical protein
LALSVAPNADIEDAATATAHAIPANFFMFVPFFLRPPTGRDLCCGL